MVRCTLGGCECWIYRKGVVKKGVVQMGRGINIVIDKLLNHCYQSLLPIEQHVNYCKAKKKKEDCCA